MSLKRFQLLLVASAAALAMKASNFAFDPNMVSVHGAGVVTV
jgi:hypothetical protein